MKKTLTLSLLFTLFSTSSLGKEPNFVDLDEAKTQFFKPLRVGNSELLYSDAVEWVLATEKFLILRPLDNSGTSHIKDKYNEDYINSILSDDNKVMYVARKSLNPFEIRKYKDEFLNEYYKEYNIAKNFVLSDNIKTIWTSQLYHNPKGEAYDFEKERYNSSFGREHWEGISGLCGKNLAPEKYISYKFPTCTNIFIDLPVDKAEQIFTTYLNNTHIYYKAYFIPDEPSVAKCWDDGNNNPYLEHDVDLSKSSCLHKKLYKMTAIFMKDKDIHSLTNEKEPIFNEEFPVIFE
ncbi:hypothetical protein PHA51_03005 [Rodentibacter pneumotropicus]|uniref:hypothetical protein n=1 Tax=Rodentibacter pneumotropicus TaxID=758 RepID=UPI00232F4FD4|nr:hypothetical protein [Rodentibacter pneumotropicus]MDC2825009.1 hypothetical protein [Rodentibacter pneumotropicus]